MRYRTGDYVRIVEESVGRGPWSVVTDYRRQPETEPSSTLEFPWPAVSDIAGREQEFLVSATGRRISLTAFNMHDSVFDDLYAVQFYQEGPAVRSSVMSPVLGSTPHGSLRSNPGIRPKLGDDFQIELKAVEEVEKTASAKTRRS